MNRSLLKNNAQLFERAMRVLDPALVVASGMVAYRIYLGSWDFPERYVVAIGGAAALCAAMFPFFGLYATQRGVTLFEELRLLLNAWLLLAAIWIAFLFFSKTGSDFSRVWSIYWIVLGFAAISIARGSIRMTLRELRRRGYNVRRISIVGAGKLGREIARRLRRTPWSGFAICAFYDDDFRLHGMNIEGTPVAGPVHKILLDLEEGSIDQVWIALPLRADSRIREILEGLRQHSVQVRFVPDIFGFTLLHYSMTEIAGLPVISLTSSPQEGANRMLKKLEDVVVSMLVLALTWPLMILIAIGIKVSSPGPVFYRQERVTWNGSRFQILKFRTMPIDAEAVSGPVWSSRDEQRATRFGAFLRRNSLDELPQFINALRGEMSVVGPRPERPEFVDRFKHEIPGYMQKHLVKAGITGWAQVNDLRGDTDISERIQYDLYYIEHWSLWFDLRIIVMTLAHIARSRHAA